MAAAVFVMALTRGSGFTLSAIVSTRRMRWRSRKGPSLAGLNGKKFRTFCTMPFIASAGLDARVWMPFQIISTIVRPALKSFP
ncbi:hypothetical protein D3C87_1840350 [compost metagenome]